MADNCERKERSKAQAIARKSSCLNRQSVVGLTSAKIYLGCRILGSSFLLSSADSRANKKFRYDPSWISRLLNLVRDLVPLTLLGLVSVRFFIDEYFMKG